MLDLETGVHFQEVVAAILGQKELNRAHVLIVRAAGEAAGRARKRAAELGVHRHRRALLDDLLVPALDGALALAEGDDVAEAVRDDLHLDVAHVLELRLEIDAIVVEGRPRLPPGQRHRPREVGLAIDETDTPAPATRRRLHDQGIPHLLSERARVLRRIEVACARNHGDTDLHGEGARRGLVAEPPDRLRRGADEGQPRRFAGLSEICVLGQEPVARVDRVGAACRGDLEDAVAVQVALRGFGRADEMGLIRVANVSREPVDRGVDRHGGNFEIVEGAHDPEGDLAPVGDQNFRKHRYFSSPLRWPPA